MTETTFLSYINPDTFSSQWYHHPDFTDSWHLLGSKVCYFLHPSPFQFILDVGYFLE